jgi:outer membrane protein assembly factor BamB
VGLGDLRIHGLRLRDGRQAWSLRGRAAFGGGFVPSGGGGAILGDRLGHVWRVDPRTGEELWVFRVPGDLLIGGPVVLDDRWVAVGDGSGQISAIDLETGHLVWRTDVGIRRVEALAADGTQLYAAEHGGAVRAFEHDPDGRLLDEPSPTTLFPIRALGNFALAAVPLFLVLALLFRLLPAPGAPALKPKEDS